MKMCKKKNKPKQKHGKVKKINNKKRTGRKLCEREQEEALEAVSESMHKILPAFQVFGT